jgi:hypothetical protein
LKGIGLDLMSDSNVLRRNSGYWQALPIMSEKSSTPQARRAVAKLIKRYFVALKRELDEQTGAFWERVETAVAARTRDDRSNENPGVKSAASD